MWCGDFNAHNTLWESDKNLLQWPGSGRIDEKHLVCINDGRNTRIDVNTGKESVLDLMLVTNTLAPCDWHVYQDRTIDSDHYPIYSQINIAMIQTTESMGEIDFQKS